MCRPLILAALLGTLCVAAQAGQSVRVTLAGEVEFNQIPAPPLGTAVPFASVSVSFLVDSDDFLNSASFPTRGYRIVPGSFEMDFGTGQVGLADPFPGTPFFVLRDNDPAVDGFFIADSVNFPTGVPLDQTGQFGAFRLDAAVTYDNDPLSSLDILDALGTYDFTGLTVFSFLVSDGPFEPMGMIFEQLTIELDNSWVDQGCQLAGVAGEPQFTGTGELIHPSANQLVLRRAAPSAPAGLFLSLSSTPTAFKGGTLKPVPWTSFLPRTTAPTGTFVIPFVFPPLVPAGTEIWAQWAIQDAAAVQGVALSNALRGIAG